ncbi:MAG: helix-turn-helix domain-containing protein [Oscillospiraceae bacterium]
MTFGRTLQELTRLCGVKRCNLADALGYDPSYISRWINGVKHPSLRSNDALPAQIAAYLTANAAPDVRARIAGQFDLRCDAADDAGFSAALASLLADTIAADRAVDPARPQPTGAENAALSPVKDIALFPEGIFMALQQAPSSARLDMICTMPIHIQFKNNDAFFRRVRGILSAGTALRVVQFVDMEDVSARTDSFCRSLCYLMGWADGSGTNFTSFAPAARVMSTSSATRSCCSTCASRFRARCICSSRRTPRSSGATAPLPMPTSATGCRSHRRRTCSRCAAGSIFSTTSPSRTAAACCGICSRFSCRNRCRSCFWRSTPSWGRSCSCFSAARSFSRRSSSTSSRSWTILIPAGCSFSARSSTCRPRRGASTCAA